MLKPTLSVCIPNYNHAHYLPQAIESLIGQSYRPTEIIVVDDGSTDDSVNVIETYARENSAVRLFRNDRNRGAMYTVNRALSLATGEFVTFQGADDIVLPGFFEKSLNLLTQHQQAGLVSGISRLIDENGKDKGLVPIPTVSDSNVFLDSHECLQALRRHGSWFMGNTMILRRQVLLEAGGFIPELHSFCDGFIHMVIAVRHGVCFIPEPLACWRRMEAGYSQATHANSRVTLDIRDTAVHLMRTSYRDLFPKDFVDSWARNFTSAVGFTAQDQLRREREKMLTETFPRLLPDLSWRWQLFVRSMDLVLRTEALALKLLWFVVFVDFSDWVSRRLRRLRKGGSKE